MRVLVTGGAGYIGSTLVPLLLAAGHRVRVVDALLHGGEPLLPVFADPAFEFVHSDLTAAGTVQAAVSGMDAVVHLAAIVGDPACARQPERAKAVNLDASLALLAAARDAGTKRFVFASTCSNYGRMKDPSTLVDENSELAPVSLYAETKVAMERALLAERGLAASPLRFATVYGVSARMRFDLTVNEFTMEMLTKGKLIVFGEQFWRPYIHVRDAARALALVLSAPESAVGGRVFNVGSTTQNYQKKQLIDLIRPHAPGAAVEYVHRDEDPRDYRVSFERVRSELGFESARTVPDGIAEVARLVRSGVISNFDDSRYRN
ncbi:MAG TPA: NAD(P)-dependent oxidoreductase [Thermoanaerobaculia bacterium]